MKQKQPRATPARRPRTAARTARSVTQRVARAQRKVRQSKAETVGMVSLRLTASDDRILSRIITEQHFTSITDAIRNAIHHYALHATDPGTLEVHKHL